MIRNNKIFRLRNNSPLITRIILFTFLLLLLSVIIAVPFFCSNRGFLAYHSKKEYQPLYSEDNSGFYGRINYYLNKALNDTSGRYEFGNYERFL